MLFGWAIHRIWSVVIPIWHGQVSAKAYTCEIWALKGTGDPSSGMSSTNAAICSGVCLSIKTQKIGVPSLDKAIATAPKSVKPTTALASSSRRRTSVHARGEAASKVQSLQLFYPLRRRRNVSN
eukprot:1373576-Amorphochlora_amoeboformis.AAC.2